MTTTDASDKVSILKTDKLGRVKVPVEKREQILDEFERSGMSGQASQDRMFENPAWKSLNLG